MGAGRQVGTGFSPLLVQGLVTKEAKRPARRPVATRKEAGRHQERAGPHQERAGPHQERAGPHQERAGPHQERASPHQELGRAGSMAMALCIRKTKSSSGFPPAWWDAGSGVSVLSSCIS